MKIGFTDTEKVIRVGNRETFLAHYEHADWIGGRDTCWGTLCGLDPEHPFTPAGAEGKKLCGACKDIADEAGLMEGGLGDGDSD